MLCWFLKEEEESVFGSLICPLQNGVVAKDLCFDQYRDIGFDLYILKIPVLLHVILIHFLILYDFSKKL